MQVSYHRPLSQIAHILFLQNLFSLSESLAQVTISCVLLLQSWSILLKYLQPTQFINVWLFYLFW